jgi:hypothetical protein
MGRAHVFNQGLTGLVLQFFQGWGSDADRQAVGAGLKVAWAFSLQAEHNLSHAGVFPSFRVHPWPAEAFWQV